MQPFPTVPALWRPSEGQLARTLPARTPGVILGEALVTLVEIVAMAMILPGAVIIAVTVSATLGWPL